MILVAADAADVAFADATALYAVTPETLLRVRTGHADPVQRAGRNATFLALSPDTRTLIEERQTFGRAPTAGYLGRQPFSPDDRTLALNTAPAQLLDLRKGARRRVGTPRWLDRAAWSPDGRMLAVFRILRRGYDVAVVDRADGRVLTRRRWTNGFERSALAWSRDGRRLAFTAT